jgi:hypothetical protein
MPSRADTIKKFARDYFTRVNFVDIYGRRVGFDYEHILAELRKEFPKAKTSKRWLRMMAYELNGVVRMPMRRRSRRALAESYAEVLLLRRNSSRVYSDVSREVKKKFPDQHFSTVDLRRLDSSLRYRKFPVPPR